MTDGHARGVATVEAYSNSNNSSTVKKRCSNCIPTSREKRKSRNGISDQSPNRQKTLVESGTSIFHRSTKTRHVTHVSL